MSPPDDESPDYPPNRPARSGTAWALLAAALVVGGVGAFFGRQLLTDAQQHAAAALQASAEAATRAQALEAEKAGLEAAKKNLEARVAALEGEKGALLGEVAEKDAELTK